MTPPPAPQDRVPEAVTNGTGPWWKRNKKAIKRGILGALLLLGLVTTVAHLGEIGRFLGILREAKPAWVAAGLAFQALTYLCAALVWKAAMVNIGIHFPLSQLVPLSVAKLFSDQVLPSGGLSGSAFFTVALKHRGVAVLDGLVALVASLTGYYASYMIMAVVSLALLAFRHDIHPWILTASVLFFVVALAVPAVVILASLYGEERIPEALKRRFPISVMEDALGKVSARVIFDPLVLAQVTLLQGAVFLLDAATLWAMLLAVGQKAAFLEALPSFVVASMVATIGVVPLGLGTFEATCVVLLGSLKVPFEAALAATLLLRGLTLWLPMLPGMWLARKELSRDPAPLPKD